MAPLELLLVEDDHAYAAMLAAALAPDVRLQHVRSASAACARCADQRFDAILLDLTLPDSSGVASVQTIHAACGSTPIVVLTSTADEQMATLALQHGAQDYLLKDEVDHRALLRAVRYSRERAAYQRALHDSEARFRALVEHGNDVITLLDERGLVLFDSRSVISVMGFTPEERIGRSLQEFLHPEDVEAIGERLAYCLQHPDELLHVQYRFLHKDGSWRWGEAVGVNRLADPTVKAIVVNHRDVTERKLVEQALRRSEEELRQAQKMEAVGRLAGGIAHDFNNVLTAIFGYADLLMEQLEPGDARRGDVEEIRQSAQRAAMLTRQLLAFSRKQVMQKRTLDLNEVIRSVERLLVRLVGEDIATRLDLAPDLVPVVADPNQIEQVLLNLAANARDAMPEGGALRIATRTRHVTGAPEDPGDLPPGRYARLEVHDTGAGMSCDIRQRVFEPFFTTKEMGKGTGLGLATVYGIVKQSGGTVTVESEEGQGTSFLVYLPSAASAATSSP